MPVTVKGNKGEWSELYVLFKLLAEGKLHGANDELEKLDSYYPVLSVIRSEKDGKIKYDINNNLKIKIIRANDDTLIKEISVECFKKFADNLLNEIKNGRERAFEIPSVWSFAESCACQSIKARSIDKRDITLIVHDARTQTKPELGFSIKSRLGSPSTLLNPGNTTNFVYKILGNEINSNLLTRFNSPRQNATGSRRRYNFSDNFTSFSISGNELAYVGLTSPIFKSNLSLIDSLMPQIMSDIVKEHYYGQQSNIGSIVNRIAENPPSYIAEVTDNPLEFLEYKVKEFLTAVALGMTPGTKWTGMYDATGGYIVVKEDGDVLCYHIYDRNNFRNYLYKNTRLDTPSTTRYDFGTIYEEDGERRIKLNLQIRFI